VLFIQYSVVEDHHHLVSSQTAHATLYVKVQRILPRVNATAFEAITRSLFGLFEALRRQETVVCPAPA